MTCHNFGASGLYKEWSVDMPDKEDVMAICCGIGWVSGYLNILIVLLK